MRPVLLSCKFLLCLLLTSANLVFEPGSPWHLASAQAGSPIALRAREPEIGDYLYCSPNWVPFDDPKSTAGHAAIYVGDGRVVERLASHPDGGPLVRFTDLSDLRDRYTHVSPTPVLTVPEHVRVAAAARAAEVARAIDSGQTVPWYSDPYRLGLRDCVGTFKQFYLDVGAITDEVGSPDQLTPPRLAFDRYREGRHWDLDTGGGNRGVVRGGSQGGIESRPLWLNRHDKIPATPNEKSSQSSLQTAELLERLIPARGPNGEVGQAVTPDVLGVSNAVLAAGMDYLDITTQQTVASVFATETVNSVYEHDYAVCARVQHLEMYDLFAFPYDYRWWWVVSASKPSAGYHEVTITLTIRLDGAQAMVDSRHLIEYYDPPPSGVVLNYQIRATNGADAIVLLDRILDALDDEYEVLSANLEEPPAPLVFARTATYRNPNVVLLLQNNGEPRPVKFFGLVWREPRRETQRWVDLTIDVASGLSQVELPVGPVHDGVIYIQAGEFLDKVYIAAGYWFSFDDSAEGGTSQVSLSITELLHPPIPDTDTTFVSPPRAEMRGRVSFAERATAVELSAFEVHVSGQDVLISWEARRDGDLLGFNVLRARTQSNLEVAQLNASLVESGREGYTFVDQRVAPSEYWYWIEAVSRSGEQTRYGPRSIQVSFVGVPLHLRAVPNPFASSTNFVFFLPKRASTTLELYDPFGRRVRLLIAPRVLGFGEHRVSWDGRDERGRPVAAGVYLCRLQSDGLRMERKVNLTR